MGQDAEDREDRGAVMLGDRAEYEAEVRVAVRYERGLAVKGLLPLVLVGLVIEVYRIVHG